MMVPTRPDLTMLVEGFIKLHNARNILRWKPEQKHLATHLYYENNNRYMRVWQRSDQEHGRGSAFCFVDKTNGDLLKPAGWKAPAKGYRGNLYKCDWILTCGPYGVGYLRGQSMVFPPVEHGLLTAITDALLAGQIEDAVTMITKNDEGYLAK